MTALRHSSFPPVWRGDARLLVLGSLPGAASLAAGRYYANPRNQFWRLIGPAAGLDLEPLDYAARLAALVGAGVALWDAARSAERRGSLDTDIRAAVPNDLAGLADRLPGLRAVAFNGGTAWRLGAPALGGREGLDLVLLPSSSPAHTIAFERKLAAWRRLAAFLRP